MRGLMLIVLVACSSPAARPSPAGPPPGHAVTAADASVDAVPDAAPRAEPPSLVPEPRGTIVVTTTDECGMMLDSVYFPEGSAIPAPQQTLVIDQTADMFRCLQKEGQTLLVEVGGHADARERDAVTLSGSRAAVIVGALVKRGVPAAWLAPQGYGATRPRDRKRTEWARSVNRRVEFLILRRGP
jgi:outer membrane protein OmpA-like peptidoglycan-associated protein